MTIQDDAANVLAKTETTMKDRVAAIKQHLHSLVDKIELSNFHLVVNGEHLHVQWDANIPPTLYTLTNQLEAHLKPQIW